MKIKNSFKKIQKVLTSRKGITPIISVILLLMMTIAIAGLAFTFLNRIQGDIENQTTANVQDFLGDTASGLRIDGVTLSECEPTGGPFTEASLTVFFRNTGTNTANNIRLFVDEVFITGALKTSLDPGDSFDFTGDATVGTISAFEITTLQCQENNFEGETVTIRLTSDEGIFESSFTLNCLNEVLVNICGT